MIRVLVVLNVFVLVQLTFSRWYLGMDAKQTKLLLHLEQKTVLVVNVVNRLVLLTF
jgi:hypothetical protein